MSDTYKVILEITADAYILRGHTNITDVVWILEAAKKNGFDQIDVGLANALGATMVITNAAGSTRMREAITERDKFGSRKEQWLNGCDTGSSSKTIYEVMTGYNTSDGSYPCDPDDFGRCHRLLLLFPEWRPRLHEVSARYPRGWTGLVEHWDELTALFLAPNYKGLYAAMKFQSREEGEAKA